MIENLSIDSGGIYGFCYLGSLKYLYEQNLLDNLKNILGSSIGSLIGLMICLKFTIYDIILLGEHLDLEKFINKDNNILDISQNYGFDNGEKLEKIIKSIIKSKMKKIDVTFSELYEYNNIMFNVLASNLTENKSEYFNKDISPNMNIWEAIRISCNIPLIFSPYKYKNNYYMDGALNSCSTDFFKDDKKSLGLTVCNFYNIKKNFDSFLGYIKNILYYPIRQIKINNINTNNVLDLSCPKTLKYEYNITLTLEQKTNLINNGYNKTKINLPKILEYINNIHDKKPNKELDDKESVDKEPNKELDDKKPNKESYEKKSNKELDDNESYEKRI